MNLLILTCSTGEGHNSAAKAIAADFTARGWQVEQLNALRFVSPAQARIITQGHIFFYRHMPKLYGTGYRLEEKRNSSQGIYRSCTRMARPLYRYLRDRSYDAICCVHVFPALAMTYIRRRWGYPVKTCFVSTDYTCSPSVELVDADYYFIPRGLREEFSCCGLPEKRLVESGIPVCPQFYETVPREEARCRLGLSKEGQLALLTGGSMGAGPMEELAAQLDPLLSEAERLVVVCGSNRHLKERLEQLPLQHTRVLGFTREMDLWMDAADFLIGKPGGLNSTEAAVKHLPMLFINAVPGCETRNLEFFLQHGYADTAPSVSELCECACRLFRQPGLLAERRQRLEEDFSYCAARYIGDAVCASEEERAALQ